MEEVGRKKAAEDEDGSWKLGKKPPSLEWKRGKRRKKTTVPPPDQISSANQAQERKPKVNRTGRNVTSERRSDGLSGGHAGRIRSGLEINGPDPQVAVGGGRELRG